MTEILTQSQPMIVEFDQAVGSTMSQHLFVCSVTQKTLAPDGGEASGVVVGIGFEPATSRLQVNGLVMNALASITSVSYQRQRSNKHRAHTNTGVIWQLTR